MAFFLANPARLRLGAVLRRVSLLLAVEALHGASVRAIHRLVALQNDSQNLGGISGKKIGKSFYLLFAIPALLRFGTVL